jgi:ABC-type branched-subunit amino acid transport system substrate-binding protein
MKFPPWPRRHPFISVGLVIALMGVAIGLYLLVRTPPCGRGMKLATPSFSVCVGLDRDSKPFSDHDPLFDLEKQIDAGNAAITGDYVTIVLMQDMAVRSTADAITVSRLRHDVEGAVTAVWRANREGLFGQTPKIKLMLANLGNTSSSWQVAVDEIKNAAAEEHIAAVTGIGQSLDTTRGAVAALSSRPTLISTIGSDVTADNMNTDPATGVAVPDFFRVSPTNSDEAQAAINYIATRPILKTVVLVKDTNAMDSYADTLASSFAHLVKGKVQLTATLPFTSPEDTEDRPDELENQFAQMHNNICLLHPDLVYFAGRGTDLKTFLKSLDSNGSCSLTSLRVMTGDDASNVVGAVESSSNYTVLFTALANPQEWEKFGSSLPSQYKNYQQFSQAFTQVGFARSDLDDGEAMISHDAAITAIDAIRIDGKYALRDPSSVAGVIHTLCGANMVGGASGFIAIGGNGNAIDKAMPVIEIQSDGSLRVDDMAWPTGTPLNYPFSASPGVGVAC